MKTQFFILGAIIILALILIGLFPFKCEDCEVCVPVDWKTPYLAGYSDGLKYASCRLENDSNNREFCEGRVISQRFNNAT